MTLRKTDYLDRKNFFTNINYSCTCKNFSFSSKFKNLTCIILFLFCKKIFTPTSSSSFGRASTPGQTQTGLEREGLFFYYPRLLYYMMLAVMLLSQHRVLSFKIVRPRAPCGARCMRHAIRTWSAVCLEAPHSQFVKEARPHLCMDQLPNTSPQAVELNPSYSEQVHPNRPGTNLGYKNTEPGCIFTIIRIPFMVCPLRSAGAEFSKVV